MRKTLRQVSKIFFLLTILFLFTSVNTSLLLSETQTIEEGMDSDPKFGGDSVLPLLTSMLVLFVLFIVFIIPPIFINRFDYYLYYKRLKIP